MPLFSETSLALKNSCLSNWDVSVKQTFYEEKSILKVRCSITPVLLGSNFGYHISLLCCIEKIWFGLEEYIIIKVLQTIQSFLFGHKMRVLGHTLFPFILLLNTSSSLYSLMLGSALRILFFSRFWKMLELYKEKFTKFGIIRNS